MTCQTFPLSEIMNAHRQDVADRWSDLRDPDLEQVAATDIVRLGGCHIPPAGQWGPVEHEITLLGLSATGVTLAAAARAWIKRTRRFDAAMQDSKRAPA